MRDGRDIIRSIVCVNCNDMLIYSRALVISNIVVGHEITLHGRMECGREDHQRPTQRRIVLIVPTLEAVPVNVE